MKKNFAIIGVAGFIAPRHLEAIASLGHNLVVAFDPNDSVGIIDRYFPSCRFFTRFEQFEAFIEDLRGTSDEVQFVSICSPNDLHFAHIRAAFRLGANAICEKPLVLSQKELEKISAYENVFDRRVYTVLQLRHHEKIQALKKQIEADRTSIRYKINLTYITSRGQWYHESWKGDARRSGGLSSNIGIHFFDMLTWIFGKCRKSTLLERSVGSERGCLELEAADVEWFLSINSDDLPDSARVEGKSTYRHITINDVPLEFSEGFTELHKAVYQDIIGGNGFGCKDAESGIKIAEELRGEP